MNGLPPDDLWGESARDGADLQEPQYRPLYDAVFEATGVGPGVRLLDAGCGCGLALSRAAGRGADVAGFDASDGLLGIARERRPRLDVRWGLIEEPPFESRQFDVVTMFNVVHHPPEVVRLMGCLAPLGRPDALFAVTTWGPPRGCSMRQLFSGLGPWTADRSPSDQVDAEPSGLVEELLEDRDFALVAAANLECPFRYHDVEPALCGLLSAAPFVAAGRRYGDDVVRETVASRLDRCRQPDGTIRIDNVFRWIVARRQPSRATLLTAPAIHRARLGARR